MPHLTLISSPAAMPKFQVDDQFNSSKKVISIPKRKRKAVIGLWTQAGVWSSQQLTDGRVPFEALREFDATVEEVRILAEVGLWTVLDVHGKPTELGCKCVCREEHVHDTCTTRVKHVSCTSTTGVRPKLLEGSVIFHDWDDYNRTSDEVKEYRAANRERQRRFREKQRRDGTYGDGTVTPLHGSSWDGPV